MLDLVAQRNKLQALDNDRTETLSMRIMLKLWSNNLLNKAAFSTVSWVTVACYILGVCSKIETDFIGRTSSSDWNVLMGGLGFITTFSLIWYMGKLWIRRELSWKFLMAVEGRMQDIPMLARATDMDFGHQVQLWRYISCAVITNIHATSRPKYKELGFAENMINLHHLMTPQEAQVLETWRPNTIYCCKDENETKWNMQGENQNWRKHVTRWITKNFCEVGLEGIEKMLKSADNDGKNELTIKEVRSMFLEKDPNFPKEDLDILIGHLDGNRYGTITWSEFERVVCENTVVLEFVNDFHNQTALNLWTQFEEMHNEKEEKTGVS
ncbi:hypothetical protein TrLO_g10148 [Triparma laevis f. longispina]|uniref:EF-hand domain-containing protein n=1 Tax=Triparma laevis f. longispina TaxID=1714387 RepID=A0A9W7A9K8_9STRA|nr:hypothetical protein TrLO_g10148 [Triparma laevis f. longispina]